MSEIDKLKRYIREYVKSIYDLKASDGIIDFKWDHPSDVEHPIQPD